MKTKIIIKISFIVLLGFLVNLASAQNKRARHQKVYAKKSWHNPYYRYTKLPKWGKTYTSVNRKAYRIAYRGLNYFYYSGIYYKKSGAKYVIARAPIGIRVSMLPRKHVEFVIKGRKYFYYYGTYYVKVDSSNEYETVSPPIGARVDALPDGYKEFQKNGDNYYEFEGTLYKEVNVDDETCYEVVKNY